MLKKVELPDGSHKYFLNGFQVPSVTDIIKHTIGVGYDAEDWYLIRGRAVHACAALIAQGKEFRYDPQIENQVRAIRRFFEEVKPEVMLVEQAVHSTLYRYAGTIDLLAQIGKNKVIIDYKASIDKDRLLLQLGGYCQALNEEYGMNIQLGAGVHIKDNGNYNITEFYNLRSSIREFLALRTTYKIKEKLCLIQN